MNISLNHKKAFVCGSTQGIGKATALVMAELGANVTLIARNETLLQNVLAELKENENQRHDYIVADFNQPDLLQEKVKNYCTENNLAEVHILVNNTGGPKGGAIYSANIAEFKKAYDMHMVANHLLVQTLVPLMKKANYGRIINIISTSVKEPIPGLGVSNTTRWAVASWAKTLSLELASLGITVNNILPGFTKTARLDSLIAIKAQESGRGIEEIEESMKATVPAGRFGTAAEIANVAAFLASPAAAYVNGVSLAVDGGRTKTM